MSGRATGPSSISASGHRRITRLLSYGVRDGQITAWQLDAALGRGKALTALARAARSNPHRDIAFRTDWDVLREEDGPDGDDVVAARAE